MLGTWEIILIVLVVLLLFGGKKIPELMRGLGKGVRSFKDGVNGKEDTDNTTKSEQINSQKEDKE
ncbi:MAG: twin-arginine translocase TatA/TatE family subunit [Paludibacteraceae bacterium]|nr:twin-arginine translocase TatA/TatE family subunit [Paludibacteraceae bacterium]